jgi:hypothetical protein
MKEFSLNKRETLMEAFNRFEKNIKKHFKFPAVLRGESQEIVNKIHLNIEKNLPFSSQIEGKILF